ncbi:MAG: YhgE/Pip domain-containing protein [Clostridium sp.]|uniref:YhgE/Pip domain-containing protein n=1 Tax=Clostridium sp. TaxID=1506 RepID=UPI00302F664C
MKNVFKIYKDDLKRVFSSYAAIIVIAALCILPSLYAWFNIAASWDPYSEEATSGIKIGVVNNDDGTTLKDKEINIGNEVIDELKNNKSLGWQFVSEEDAKNSVENGKYYAMITIPENFSKDLTSIVTDEVKKGEIIYEVNEKINAIAPKLTDKGATGVQENVSKAVVEAVSHAIFGVGNSLGIELENQIPKISTLHNSLLELQGKFNGINETTDLAYDGATKLDELIKEIQKDIPLIQDTIKNAEGLSSSIEEFLVGSKDGVNKIAPIIKDDINIINEISTDVSKYTEGVINAINSGSEKVPEMIDSLIGKVNGMEDITESLINLLGKLNKLSPLKPLDKLIGDLQTVSNTLNDAIQSLNTAKDNAINGIKPDLSLLNNVITLSNRVSSITSEIYNSFDTTIIPKLNEIFDKGYEVAENAVLILKEAENKLPEVEDILNIAYKGVGNGIEGLDYVKEVLPKSEEMINDLTEKIGEIDNNQELNEIIDLLKANVQKRSDFLSNPVNIIEHKIFPIANYGTAMTPFYSVLSLWVGILLLVSILTVNSKGEYKVHEVYFGKLLLFSTIAAIQGLIVALGDLYLLKITCANPALFVAGNVFTSIVFTFIVYSLVSVFGNVGKVMGIILLVLQVAGSGGTFPIQLTPKFFQVINPYLPFTYAISFSREAIGGVVQTVLSRDIIILLIYIALGLIMAIVLKKPINKLLHGFVENFEKSEIGEH